MIETLRWWLAATVIGAVALPYTFRLFRFLPDRGFSVARTAGLLLTIFAMWTFSVLGIAPYTAGTAILVLAVLAAGGVILAGQDRAGLMELFTRRRGLVIGAEAVFAIFLFGAALFRAYAPDIDATEKPFEYAFFNAVLQSERMPAPDPWYGGEPMSYYYGGYLVTALFTKLTGTAPPVAFNLGVALTAGLTAVGAFGLGANLLLALPGRSRRAALSPGNRAAVVAGSLSVVLLVLLGNLVGLFELASVHGWGSAELYRRLGIEGITGAASSREWYPDQHWFWWRATRLGSSWNIFEFPFFSFMLGDLHAHVMVLPFSLLGFLSILNLIRGGARPGWALVRQAPFRVAFLGVLAGMLALSNSWDQPIFLLLLFTAALVMNVDRGGLSFLAVGRAALFVLPVVLLSVVLYIPFFAYLHPATSGISPVKLSALPEGVPGEAMVFPPHHFLMFWAPLLLVGGGAIVLQAARRRVWRAPVSALVTALAATLAPLFLWAAVIVSLHFSPADLVDEVRARAVWWSFGSYWLVQGGLLVLVALGILSLLAEARRPVGSRRDGRIFLVLAATAAVTLIHVIELFYVKEPTPARTNTIFKFSYTAWLLLAGSGGAALVDTVRAVRWRGGTAALLILWTVVMGLLTLVAWFGGRRVLPVPLVWALGLAAVYWLSPRGKARTPLALPVWTGATALVLALGMIYPVTAAMNRTRGFTAKTTLDGLAFLQNIEPDELEAVAWMRERLPGQPMVLEGVGGDYSAFGRVSGRTGFFTVIGWPFHEAQERGGRDYPGRQQIIALRERDVETIYRTSDSNEARALLDKHGIDYVYVGSLELEKYGVDGIAKFELLGYPVYRNRSVTIYAVREPPPLAAR